MKKRILSLVCAVAVIAAMMAIGISAVSAVDPIVDISQQAFNANDWTGDTNNIDSSNRFYATAQDKKTIWTAASYNLTGGFTFSSRCYLNANVNNFYGEYAALYVGEPGTGIELRIQNVKGQKDWNARLVVAGNEVASVNVMGSPNTSAPNGGWELVYDDGMLTVNHIQSVGSTPKTLTWNLASSGTATQIDVSSVDLTDTKFGVHIEGNYSTAEKRVWASYWLKVMPAATSSAPTSSAPVSSALAPSEPVSSEVASSEVASSEIASSEIASSEIASSTVPAVGEILVLAFSGALNAEDWDPSDKIVDGKLATGASASVYAVTYVKTFDLGTDWTASMKFATPTYMGNDYAQPTKLIIGDVEAVAYNSDGSNAAPYIGLNVKGAEKGRYDLDASLSTTGGVGYSGTLTLTYKNGIITVAYKDEIVITYDATADALDFSAVNPGLSAKGNWSSAKNFKILEFGLTSADVKPEPGAPIDTVVDGVLNANDWTGDTTYITDTGLFYADKTNKNTIWTAKAYDLSGGFKFSSKLQFKSYYTNYWGEHASIYIGEKDVGLELRIKNRSGIGMYDGFLYFGGQEIAKVDLMNAPNGVWEIVYKNGKVTVNLGNAPVTWTLADNSTSTSVSIPNADFSRVNIGLYVHGNWSTPDRRNWSTYNLSAVSGGSGGANGSTGDTRNVVIPAVAIVLGVCAVAFVAKSKKANA